MKYNISEQSIDIRTTVPLMQNDNVLQMRYVKKHLNKGAWSNNVIIRDDYKLCVFFSSGVVCVFDSKIHPISPGTILLIPPYGAHYGSIQESGLQEYFEFNIPPAFFSHLADGHVLLPPLTNQHGESLNLMVLGERQYNQVSACLYSLLEEMPTNTALGRMCCYSRFLVFLCAIKEYCNVTDEKASQTSNVPELIVHALSIISGELENSKFAITTLAKKLYVSPSYLSRLFRQYLGISPYQYILKMRISKACQLLNNTKKSITETCFLCGFEDCSHFISTFRHYVGVTPYSYQKSALRNRQESEGT